MSIFRRLTGNSCSTLPAGVTNLVMPNEPRGMSVEPMKYNHLIPLVDVSNVERSIEFYQDALGFTMEDKLLWNGRIEWALLSSGTVHIMLSNGDEPLDDTYTVPKNGVFFIYPDDIDALHQSLRTKGYDTSALQAGQRGAREFYLQDPDGYVLWFSHKRVYEAVPA